jgi:hypothetical protein
MPIFPPRVGQAKREFCGGGFAIVESRRLCNGRSRSAKVHLIALTFAQIQAKASTQTMTSSQGCTVTPPSIEGSSAGGREGQSLYQEEVKGKETTLEYLAVLLRQEGTLYPPCEDYLSDFDAVSSSSESDPVSESWRRKLCEWCFEVVDHFKVRKFVFGPPQRCTKTVGNVGARAVSTTCA